MKAGNKVFHSLILYFILSLGPAVLISCSKSPATLPAFSDRRPLLRVSMYNSSSFPAWRKYVETACPDIHIDWSDNRNSFSNVLYQAKNGNMPDIVAIRRFECDGAAELAPYLEDLSGLELTKTFYAEYLSPYQHGGKQCWLPAPGTVDGIYANLDLFESLGIALPSDLPSFVDVCGRMQKKGIRGLCCDLSQGWSCTALLEGFGIASSWKDSALWTERRNFEEGRTVSIERAGFSGAAAAVRALADAGAIRSSDLAMSTENMAAMFSSGRTAMMLHSSDEHSEGAGGKHRHAMLPYFGPTAGDSWLYTYPVFCIGMARNSGADKIRQKARAELISAMLNAEAQGSLNRYGDGLISYNKNIQLQLSPSLSLVKPLIEKKRCFIRLLNSNSFTASRSALSMLLGGASDKTASAALSGFLFAQKAARYIGRSTASADNERDSAQNSPAASIIASIVRQHFAAGAAIIDSREAAAPIYKADYTNLDAAAIVLNGPVYLGDVSSTELNIIVEKLIGCTTSFRPGNIEPVLDYPAFSGLLVTVNKKGEILDLEGAPSSLPGAGLRMRLAVSPRVYAALAVGLPSIAAQFRRSDTALLDCVEAAFMSGSRLPAPAVYFAVR